jgi:uncharacterized protein YunC (DUF1805 family)
MPSTQLIEIRLISIDGKLVQVVNKELAKAGLNQLKLETSTIQNGAYILQLVHDNKQIFSKRILVQHN